MAPNPCDKDKPLKKGGLEQTVSVPLLLQVILEYGHRPVCCLFMTPDSESGSGSKRPVNPDPERCPAPTVCQRSQVN